MYKCMNKDLNVEREANSEEKGTVNFLTFSYAAIHTYAMKIPLKIMHYNLAVYFFQFYFHSIIFLLCIFTENVLFVKNNLK